MNAKKVKIACEPKWDWVSWFSPDGYALVNCSCESGAAEDLAFGLHPSEGKFGVIENLTVLKKARLITEKI